MKHTVGIAIQTIKVGWQFISINRGELSHNRRTAASPPKPQYLKIDHLIDQVLSEVYRNSAYFESRIDKEE